jgi:hypothetical protein
MTTTDRVTAAAAWRPALMGKLRKARKVYQCDNCTGFIQKGQQYLDFEHYEKFAHHRRYCQKCKPIHEERWRQFLAGQQFLNQAGAVSLSEIPTRGSA